MFERNKVDTTQQRHAVAVEITLDDGRTMKGKFAIPLSKSLFDALNGDASFVEFEPYGEERAYISKTALRAVRLLPLPDGRSLDPLKDSAGFDPHTVLGVPKGASAEETRKAFHKLSMRYHPDRYANAELPDEVSHYLDSMARRINTAYAIIQDGHNQSKRFAEHRTAPIYESRRT